MATAVCWKVRRSLSLPSEDAWASCGIFRDPASCAQPASCAPASRSRLAQLSAQHHHQPAPLVLLRQRLRQLFQCLLPAACTLLRVPPG